MTSAASSGGSDGAHYPVSLSFLKSVDYGCGHRAPLTRVCWEGWCLRLYGMFHPMAHMRQMAGGGLRPILHRPSHRDHVRHPEGPSYPPRKDCRPLWHVKHFMLDPHMQVPGSATGLPLDPCNNSTETLKNSIHG